MARNSDHLNMDDIDRLLKRESACVELLRKLRWGDGFLCPRCTSSEAYFLAERGLYTCSRCRHQTSVLSGTLFHRSHVPILTWMKAALLMLKDPSVPMLEIQRRLKLGRYATTWALVHKLRTAMGTAVRNQLVGIIEVGLDQLRFHGTVKKLDGKVEEVVVFGALQVSSAQPDLRLVAIASPGPQSLCIFIQKYVNLEALVLPGPGTSPEELSRSGIQDRVTTSASLAGHPDLPHATGAGHPPLADVFASVGQWLHEDLHDVHPTFLQSYLDQFSFRFENQFSQDLGFRALMRAACRHRPTSIPQYKEGKING